MGFRANPLPPQPLHAMLAIRCTAAVRTVRKIGDCSGSQIPLHPPMTVRKTPKPGLWFIGFRV